MTAPPIDPLAQAVMVAYCGWDPTTPVTDETVLLDGNGTPLLLLPCLNVTDVSAVTVTPYYGDPVVAAIGPAGDVGWKPNGELIWQSSGVWPWRWGGVWPEGSQNVAVTYSGGYPDEGTPDDLLAALQSLSRRTASTMPASRRMGTAAVAYGKQIADGGLLTVEQMVLDRYRLPRVA